MPATDRDCLKCRRLDLSHRRLTELLRKSPRRFRGSSRVYVRSGIRYDLAMASPAYLEELCRHHISGRLKIAPEHVSERVLKLMNKGRQPLDEFRSLFKKLSGNRLQGLKCYFMVGHPGTSEAEARELAAYVEDLKEDGANPVEGVQVFTPTPMTRSTCMYHTGMDPVTGRPVYVPRTYGEKKDQKRILA